LPRHKWLKIAYPSNAIHHIDSLDMIVQTWPLFSHRIRYRKKFSLFFKTLDLIPKCQVITGVGSSTFQCFQFEKDVGIFVDLASQTV
jgi:hypothetical protein